MTPILSAGALLISVTNESPKRRDLERDGRFALHAFPGNDDEEFYLTGNVVRVDDAAHKAAAHHDAIFTPRDTDPLFALVIDVCLWSRWENMGQPDTYPVRRIWKASGLPASLHANAIRTAESEQELVMSIRGEAAVVGFHELPTQKDYAGRSALGLMAESAHGAIRDAGLRKEDIDGLIAPEGINSITVAEYMRIQPRWTTSVTAHGASGATSVATASAVVAAGMANYVLCVFGESRPRGSSRIRGENTARSPGRPTRASEWELPYGPVIAANGGYGLIKQRYMYRYGTTQEQFAKCAVDERFNAAANPNAVWYQQPVTMADVLNSRYTNDPLHLLESVMPCSGAAAVIVTTAERAKALPNPPVYVLGASGPATRHDVIWQEDDVTVTPVVLSAPAALQMAQYSPRDIQFAEFYDCYTILVMMTLEDAGICPKGEIGGFYESTDTTYQGEFPINTDGGQIGAGQPGLAGGFRHVVEGVRQVMGRGEQRQVEKHDLCLVNG